MLSLLLLSAAIGCRSAPADRQATVPLHNSANKVANESGQNSAKGHAVVPAGFQAPEPLPVPPRGDEGVTQPLSLANLESIAFQNNPTLAAAVARREAARGRQIQAGLYPNPSFGYHATEIGTNGTAGAQGAFVAQRFITGGKLRLDQAVAGREVFATQFELAAQEQRVLNDVRVRFYEALVAQRRVELTEELVGIGDNLVRATKTLLQGREASQNDLLQAEIRAEDARILLDNARNENVEAWRRLAAVIGVPQLPKQPLSGELDSDLPHLDWESIYGALLATHPELNAARARVDRAGIAIRRARSEPIPNVDVFASLRHQDASNNQIANIQAGIPLPIFDANQGNIRASQAEWAAARREVERLELELQDRFAVTFRRYANARQQVERYGQKIVPRAKESLNIVTNAYEQGEVDYLTLLIAQETYLQVSLSHLDALRELRVSSAIIEGQLLTESLSARE